MPKLDRFTVVWIAGADCEGCTIAALGDTTAGGIEALLTGAVEGLPPVRLLHPVLSIENGEAFCTELRRTASGELGPYALVVEAGVPDEGLAGAGFYSGMGEEGGRPIPVPRWLDILAPRASVVLAWGDCAVWGGPHTLAPNPIHATGTAMYLGLDYRSTLGLPVINLPGCAPPTTLIATLETVLRWVQEEGPPPELDAVNRPLALYSNGWKGALATWRD